MPIHIISTYAPHNGHTEETKRRHWEDVQELLNKTCKQHPIIRGEDANGQLGNRNREEEEKYAKKGQIGRKIIGPYTRARQAEKGNGARLHRICRIQQMIPMTTWEKPKIIKQDRWKQQPGDATRGAGERKLGKYMTTWTSPNGNIRGQIDYIMINAKHRNTTRTAQRNIQWHGNMHQIQQNRVQTMKLYYNAHKKYKKPIPAETGKERNTTSRNFACAREN